MVGMMKMRTKLCVLYPNIMESSAFSIHCADLKMIHLIITEGHE